MNVKEIVRFLIVWAICAGILLGALVIAKCVEEYRIKQTEQIIRVDGGVAE